MRRFGLRRMGTRLLLSFVAASVAAAASGFLAVLLAPPLRYERLMLEIRHPPPGATAAQMDRVIARAVDSAILLHVVISLVVAVGVAALLASYFSAAISASLERIVAATRRLARGDYEAKLAEGGIEEFAALAGHVNRLRETLDVARSRRNLAIASVSHELRTPVTALRGYCDALRDGVIPWSPQVLDRLDLAVERLERMAGDLAALSRAEGGSPADLRSERLDVQAVLRSAAQSVQPAADAAGVRLQIEPPPPDLYVRADRVRLGEILENLLLNSVAHTPEGSLVQLMARGDGRDVLFSVRDEGRGIAPQDLPHVTEPFFRGEGGSAGRSSRPGMGLGLAIARRLAEQMQGRIAIASPGPGRGTEATLRLPRAGDP